MGRHTESLNATGLCCFSYLFAVHLDVGHVVFEHGGDVHLRELVLTEDDEEARLPACAISNDHQLLSDRCHLSRGTQNLGYRREPEPLELMEVCYFSEAACTGADRCDFRNFANFYTVTIAKHLAVLSIVSYMTRLASFLDEIYRHHYIICFGYDGVEYYYTILLQLLILRKPC